MKIALINENSQASKNPVILETLKKVVEPMGHQVFNYGMKSADDHYITYVQNGILASILLNSKAVDFVITGCGTGQGALIALNSFPGVMCGYSLDPSDAYLFGQINDGNAISMPFAKSYGWGAEFNLEYTFEKLFSKEFGQGYPAEKAEVEQANKKILETIRANNFQDLITCLKNNDQDLVKGAIGGEDFEELFFANCQDEEIASYIKSLL